MKKLIKLNQQRLDYTAKVDSWVKANLSDNWTSTTVKDCLIIFDNNNNTLEFENNKLVRNSTKLPQFVLDGLLSGVANEIYLEVGDI